MSQNYSHLSLEQRYKIEALLQAGISKTEIAKQIGVDRSTIYREINRNSVYQSRGHDKYKANTAQNFAAKRAYRPPKVKSNDKDISRRIIWLIKCDWSPEQIACTCKKRNIPMLSMEGIYQWLYKNRWHEGKDLLKHLRRGHRKRRKRSLNKQPRVIIKDKVSIKERPEIIDNQERFGDYETDLVKCTNGYFITITERKSLYNILVKIPNKKTETVINGIIKMLRPYKELIYSITSDNGTEFTDFKKIVEILDIEWFFADPYCSQQRGCNENQNGLLRQYFKNNTDLSKVTENDVLKIQNKLNNRPRKKNNFLSPKKILLLHGVALET